MNDRHLHFLTRAASVLGGIPGSVRTFSLEYTLYPPGYETSKLSYHQLSQHRVWFIQKRDGAKGSLQPQTRNSQFGQVFSVQCDYLILLGT